MIQLFRRLPGDLGIEDAPVIGTASLASAKKAAADHLRGHFGDHERQHHQKPYRARLLGMDGTVVASFEMAYAGIREISNA